VSNIEAKELTLLLNRQIFDECHYKEFPDNESFWSDLRIEVYHKWLIYNTSSEEYVS
jgi:hypothetical protein